MTGIGSDYCNKHHKNCECCLMSLFIAMNSDSDAIELVWIARKVSGLFKGLWETVRRGLCNMFLEGSSLCVTSKKYVSVAD